VTLANQRSLFDISDDIAYLNCSYMSPLPRASREAGQAGVARKSEPWKISAQDFFSESETARSLWFNWLCGCIQHQHFLRKPQLRHSHFPQIRIRR